VAFERRPEGKERKGHADIWQVTYYTEATTGTKVKQMEAPWPVKNIKRQRG
jgi:hypothetical protein